MANRETDVEQVAVALLRAIPADITTDAQGEPLDDDSIAEVQRMRAGDWARAGHRDADRVQAWIAAGVVSEWVALLAEKRGFRPGDPWVPTGFGAAEPSGEWSEYAARYEDPAGRFQVRRNRRRAARAWRLLQTRIGWSEAALQDAAEMIRASAVPGAGDGRYLTALMLVAGTDSADPDLTASALLDIVDQARAVRQLGEETRDRRGDPLTPAWLEREMVARGLPTGDTCPLRDYPGSQEQWLDGEARSWCEYVDYLDRHLDVVRKNLPRLTGPERATGERQLDTAKTDCVMARTSWSAVAGKS
jgi:hypothetical protein